MERKNSDPNSPEKDKPRNIFEKDEFFSLIESGLKTCELRVAFDSFLRIKPGQILEFRTAEGKSLRAKVIDTRKYPDLESMVGKEDIKKIAPGISLEQADQTFRRFFNADDVKRLGLVVIEFKKM